MCYDRSVGPFDRCFSDLNHQLARALHDEGKESKLKEACSRYQRWAPGLEFVLFCHGNDVMSAFGVSFWLVSALV